MIVGICGLSGSGKTEVEKLLVMNHRYASMAFADEIKRFCMKVFGFSIEQLWGPSEKRNEPDKRYPRHLHETERDGKCPCCGLAFTPGKGYMGPCYLTPRYALQQLGTEWGRGCYPDVWVEHTLRMAKDLLKKDGNVRLYDKTKGLWVHEIVGDMPEEHIQAVKDQVPEGVVITDVRFKNEMRAIGKMGGWVVRVTRPGHEKPKWRHPSETEQTDIPDVEFNSLILNEGSLEDLAIQVKILAGVLS